MKFGTCFAIMTWCQMCQIGQEPFRNAALKSAMSNNQRSNGSLKELTDAEIRAAIHYLDPDVRPERAAKRKIRLLVICVGVLFLLLGLAALVLCRTSAHG